MDGKERCDAIIAYLRENETAEVSALSEVFQVSEMTIRRDLDRLEQKNALIRVHGGAKLIYSNMYEPPLNDRMRKQLNEKKKLGEYAASLVEAGDAIALDDSSTTFAMIPYLKVPVTVITNHINVAIALAENDAAEIILLGGKLRKTSMSFTGTAMEDMLRRFHVDKAFLSAKAICAEEGIFDASMEEARTKELFMASAQKTFFLFDHTKLETRAFYKVCSIEQASAIITNECPATAAYQEKLCAYCEQAGTGFYLVS